MTRSLASLIGLLFGVLLLVLPTSKFALALVGLIVFAVLIQRPYWSFLLFGFVATLLPYSTVNLGIRMTVSEALLALTWVAVGWQMVTGQKRLHFQYTERAVLGLAVFSIVPFVVGQVMIHAEGSGLVNWIRWLLNLSTLMLVPILLETREKRLQMIWALLLGTGIMLLFSIALFIKDRDAQTMIPYLEKLQYAHPEALKDIFSANYTRMASPWVHPNLTGGALALLVPLALFVGFTSQGWRRVVITVIALLGAAGLMFSISRGAILSLVLVMLWLFYWRVHNAGRIISLATVLSVALVLFYPPLQERLSTMFSPKNASTEVRKDEYQKFPSAVAHYPLGIGFKVDPPVPDTDLLGISNLWLNYMYKMGAIGMLMFFWITYRWWQEVKPRVRQGMTRPETALWLGTVSAVLAALGTGIFDHYYSFTMVLVGLFWMLVGISLAEARQLRSDKDTSFELGTSS